jgi:hypothetical protein
MHRGARRRYVTREDAAVWCPSGRWGPRRVRVTECVSVFRAEDVYTALLREADQLRPVRPGARGSVTFSIEGRTLSAAWEVRANAVWRFGRVFLRCSRCERLATRLYMPLAHSWAACRRCWGLTYESRQRANYRDCGRFAGLGLTSRSAAQWQTLSERERRAEAAAVRYAERRTTFKATCQKA